MTEIHHLAAKLSLVKCLSAARVALAAATALSAPPALAQLVDASQPNAASSPSLEEQFRDPPNSARPRVWWHWMNGNVTKDGIAKDLAWMKRVGIGGMQNFDVDMQTPLITDKRLVYMTPEWRDAFRFAASEAERLGLELAIASSPGFTETGGPWVRPRDAMKKLVWSETEIAAGMPLAGALTPPPSTTGPYHTIPADPDGGLTLAAGQHTLSVEPLYADVAVLAWPVPASSVIAMASYSDGAGKALDPLPLNDEDLTSGVPLAGAGNDPPTLIAKFPAPETIRSARLFVTGAAGRYVGGSIAPVLEASEDGETWRKVVDIPATAVRTTVSFAPVTAKQFRVVLKRRNGGIAAGFTKVPIQGLDMSTLGGSAAAMLRNGNIITVADFGLSSEARVDQVEAKAGFTIATNYFDLGTPLEVPGVPTKEIVNLTGRMRADGTLVWTPPSLPKGGRWRVLRLGYSLVGTMNHPAPREATGLEVDKFDGEAVRRYMKRYLGMYHEAAGPGLVGKGGVRALLTDSIEAGAANWTPRMIEQFLLRRGYDPVPWLPALTGTIVESRARTDAFLYDYRRTLADLMASEHYGTIAAAAHENGLLVYGEALENQRPSLGDDMAMRRYADIPMSALWSFTRQEGPKLSYLVDMRGAASVANIYGRRFVAAESMTSLLSPWGSGPRDLKRVIDMEFATGINRPVVHTSVHVPVDDRKPGLSLSMFGQYFNRNESWAELATPWVTYMARNSLLLQQGRSVADVGYFYGEEAPLTALYGEKAVADAPKRHAYDFVNADALLEALRNDGADLVTPGGARYRVLYLGGSSSQMTLPVLRKLAALANGGATIVGAKPAGNPSLAGSMAEFVALTGRLWPVGGKAQVGRGQVIASTDIDAVLAQLGIAPDFAFTGQADSELLYLHRRLDAKDGEGDSYFINNRKDRVETGEARFRVVGKAPELWQPETGEIRPLSYRTERGETLVPLTLAPDEAVHVVFRKPAISPALAVEPVAMIMRATLGGPWDVAFEAGRGAPSRAILPALAPLDTNPDPGIRYFSGIATYAREFNAPPGWKAGEPLWLDLGEAREVAEVIVNGTHAGYAWNAPYRIDISATARPGRNRLEIRVANLWVNRMVGDRQPGATPITWVSSVSYNAKAPLRRSGLIGPVTIFGQAELAK